jgi:hypothetical protein
MTNRPGRSWRVPSAARSKLTGPAWTVSEGTAGPGSGGGDDSGGGEDSRGGDGAEGGGCTGAGDCAGAGECAGVEVDAGGDVGPGPVGDGGVGGGGEAGAGCWRVDGDSGAGAGSAPGSAPFVDWASWPWGDGDGGGAGEGGGGGDDAPRRASNRRMGPSSAEVRRWRQRRTAPRTANAAAARMIPRVGLTASAPAGEARRLRKAGIPSWPDSSDHWWFGRGGGDGNRLGAPPSPGRFQATPQSPAAHPVPPALYSSPCEGSSPRRSLRDPAPAPDGGCGGTTGAQAATRAYRRAAVSNREQEQMGRMELRGGN